MNSAREPSVQVPVGKLASISLDCPDPSSLADFYASLLGMSRIFETPDGSIVALSDGTKMVTMMQTRDYVAPTWPEAGQLQQMHLDVSVTDLPEAVVQAVSLGAREADQQPKRDLFRVLVDPAGHPFCLTTVTLD
jgi:catechol-2,3-dioxygenase